MDKKTNKVLDIKYIAIQIFYLMNYCAMLGYASVYLLELGFSNGQIGISLAMSSVVSVICQPIIASFVDKHREVSLNTVIKIALTLVVIASAILYFLSLDKIVLIVLHAFVLVILLTLQPLINSIAFGFEKQGYVLNFGLARGMGSVAYAFTSLGLGILLESVSATILPLCYMVISMILFMFIHTFALKQENLVEKEVVSQLSLLGFVKKYKRVMIVLAGVVFVYLDHAIINNFFIQIVTNVGGTSSSMGKAIFLAAMLELPTMTFFTLFLKKIKCSNLFKIAVIFFSIKHVITYLASSMFVIYIAQATQIAGYALFIPASVYYMNEVVENSDLTKGQAMLTGAITLSNVFASLIGGILLDAYGVSTVLLIGAVGSIIGTVIVCMGLVSIK